MRVAQGEMPGRLEIDPRTSVYVVAAAEGYPGHYEKGKPIADRGSDSEDAWLFYSGVTKSGDHLKTAGGRVFGACGIASGLGLARNLAYGRLEQVTFEGRFFRTDIGTF
jgi:phosphoribosylamine-glycine ligase